MSIALCLAGHIHIVETGDIGTVDELLQLKFGFASDRASLVAGGRWFPGAAHLGDVVAAAGDGPALVVVPAVREPELLTVEVVAERVVRQSASLCVDLPIVPDEERSATLARAAQLVEEQLFGGEHEDAFWETESVDDVELNHIGLD